MNRYTASQGPTGCIKIADPQLKRQSLEEAVVTKRNKKEGIDMAKLRLISLACNTTEDNLGADETYLLVNGVKVWGASMNNNDVVDLSGVDDLDFRSRARVELYDEDSPDDDDHLGIFYVRSGQAGRGEREYKFVEDEADYTLTYEVLA
jgi:hypothetical protein